MQTVRYLRPLPRAVIALLASLAIIFFGNRQLDYKRLVTDYFFYQALAISSAVAYLLIFIVHRGTIWLDKHYSWKVNFPVRLIMQLLLCLTLPALLDIILISGQLALTGQDIFSTGFLNVDFTVVVLLLSILNMVYVVQFFRMQDEPDRPKKVELRIDYAGTEITISEEDLLIICTDARKVKLVTMMGKSYWTNLTLTELEEEVQGTSICRINRSVMVNLRAICGTTRSERGKMKLVLEDKYYAIPAITTIDLEVKYEYLEIFAARYTPLA